MMATVLKILVGVALLFAGCTDGPAPEEPVKKDAKNAKLAKGKKKKKKKDLPPPVKIQPKPLPPDPCKVFVKLAGEPPLFVEDQRVMITRFMKPCVTREGERGYEADTPWIAMGFPCTAGGGSIKITGYATAPKLVSFPLSTDCPMAPKSAKDVDVAIKAATDLPPEAQIMAYYPFVVQYWEIPDFDDADVGFSVDLVTVRARESAWRQMRVNEQPIKVRLYGRENAWVQGDKLYEVEAQIKKSGNRSFLLEVVSAKGMTAEEVEAVKERCYGLTPRRNCAAAF